jgi:hypothetical protein
VAGQPPNVTVQADANDPSGIADVFLTWASGPTVRLTLSNRVWSGSAALTSPPPSEIQLIALDANGNRADAFYGFTAECF